MRIWTTGKVELTEENGKQKITWTLDNLKSGNEENLTMKLKLKDELIGQGGIYPTNESTEVISKIESQEEDVTTTNSPILADNYRVIYDGNAPDGSTVTNIPEAYNYSVYSTIEISNQIPRCEGYEFKGWDITTNGVTRVSEDYFIMPESDVVIKAEWSKVGITKSMNGTVNNMGDPIMKSYDYNSDTDYHNSTYKSKITSIVTKDNMEIPSTAIESWDVSAAGDGSVIAYIEDDGRGTGTYKVTIGAQGNIMANPNSRYLFYDFENVESIDLTYLDTSHVTNMDSMFGLGHGTLRQDSQLTTIIFGDYWDTSQVTGMRHMFFCCDALVNLDLNKFDTSNVKDMNAMFSDCSNLTNLNVSKFDTSKVTDMGSMFSGCSSLTSLDVSNFDTSQVTDMSSMFSSCGSLNSLDVSKFNTSRVTSMSNMFYSCSSLTSLNLSNFNTGNVTDMSDMFQICSSLTSLNLSSFNTSQVINMGFMFSYCNNLAGLDVSNFDTSKVTDMSNMFRGCENLTNFSLSNFDTSQVTNMNGMFASCENLISLDLSHFNTSQVTDMSSMFSYCSSLTNINLSNFDTSQVISMKSMFTLCRSLTSLDLSNFDTSKVTDMSSMFSSCSSLTSLDLSSFDTSKVTDMNWMFNNCTSLRVLDIRNLTFDNGVTVVNSALQTCSRLQTVYVKNEDIKNQLNNNLSSADVFPTIIVVGT